MAERLDTHENSKQRTQTPLGVFQVADELRSLKNETAYKEGQHNQITLIHDGALTVALFAFHAGNVLKDHRVSGPISVQVLSGRLNFSTDDGRREELKEGSLLSLSGGISHSVEAVEDSVMLLSVVQVGPPAKQSEG